jgi:Fic family protein
MRMNGRNDSLPPSVLPAQCAPWLLYFITSIEETARWTIDKIAAIRALLAHTVEYVRRVEPKIYSHELVNLIFEQPYCRIQNVTRAGIAGRQTASNYLKQLVRIGVLNELAFGREKLFVHPKLMQLLRKEANDYPPYPSGKV